MGWAIYYAAALIISAVAAAFFRESVVINAFSIVPTAFFIAAIVQACTLRSQARDPENSTRFNTAFTPAFMDLTSGEYAGNCLAAAFSMMISLPLYLPLALFLGGLLKIVLSVAVYFIFFALDAVVFRVRHGAQIRARLDIESRELEDQRKKRRTRPLAVTGAVLEKYR